MMEPSKCEYIIFAVCNEAVGNLPSSEILPHLQRVAVFTYLLTLTLGFAIRKEVFVFSLLYYSRGLANNSGRGRSRLFADFISLISVVIYDFGNIVQLFPLSSSNPLKWLLSKAKEPSLLLDAAKRDEFTGVGI